ncbi:hypothetical protein BD769DRAFT_1400273 [Suillus cothurnatus]|nr:hypothetical protein BD769DRAFT_1400273 [Suillus cothurnatus]
MVLTNFKPTTLLHLKININQQSVLLTHFSVVMVHELIISILEHVINISLVTGAIDDIWQDKNLNSRKPELIFIVIEQARPRVCVFAINLIQPNMPPRQQPVKARAAANTMIALPNGALQTTFALDGEDFSQQLDAVSPDTPTPGSITVVLVRKIISMHTMSGHSLKSVTINIVAYFATFVDALIELFVAEDLSFNLIESPHL